MDPFSAFFRDPRVGQRRPSHRRQERQDFFPSLSNSLFFDPFTYPPAGQSPIADQDSFFGMPSPHKQRLDGYQRQRQQAHPQQLRGHTQGEDEDEDEDEKGEEDEQDERLAQNENNDIEPEEQQEEGFENDDDEDEVLEQEPEQKRYHPQHQQQSHPRQVPVQRKASHTMVHEPPLQSPPKHHQQHPHHETQQQYETSQMLSGSPSKRRNRRHKKHGNHGQHGAQLHQKPASHVHEHPTPAAPDVDQDDEMKSLVEAAFGDEQKDDSPTAPIQPKQHHQRHHLKHKSHQVPPHTDHSAFKVRQSTKPTGEDDKDEFATEETETGSEEDHMLPDREVQAKSRVELDKIDANLEDLSIELGKIVRGEIANKRLILMTEENLVKAMLRIDAVESGGDPAIRKRRKELISKVEGLLVRVDEFKQRAKISVIPAKNGN